MWLTPVADGSSSSKRAGDKPDLLEARGTDFRYGWFGAAELSSS